MRAIAPRRQPATQKENGIRLALMFSLSESSRATVKLNSHKFEAAVLVRVEPLAGDNEGNRQKSEVRSSVRARAGRITAHYEKKEGKKVRIVFSKKLGNVKGKGKDIIIIFKLFQIYFSSSTLNFYYTCIYKVVVAQDWTHSKKLCRSVRYTAYE